MKLIAELWVFTLFIVILKGQFILNILERVTDYGQTAKLLCDIGSKSNTPVGFWDFFIPDLTLAFAVVRDETPRNDTKYSGHFVENGFTLEIRNLSKEDLNISYKCSVYNNVSEPRLLLEADVFEGNMHLVVVEKVSKYGETLKLLCVTKSCNNETCHWKYGWRKNTLEIEFERERSNWRNTGANSKYYSNLVNDGFTLEIRNVSITDLDINYECYLPFNKSELFNLTVGVAFEDDINSAKNNDKGLEFGVITAITIGVLVFVIAFLILINFLVRKKWRTPDLEDEQIEMNTANAEERAILAYHENDHCEEKDIVDRSLLNNSQNSQDEQIEMNTANAEERALLAYHENDHCEETDIVDRSLLNNSQNSLTMASDEDDNYIRMAMLLTGISSRAVRVQFDKEFSPLCLDSSIMSGSLKNLKTKGIINQSQWNLLIPTRGWYF